MTLTLRGTKGSALTHAELDGNFQDLDGRAKPLTSGPGAPAERGVAGIEGAHDVDSGNGDLRKYAGGAWAIVGHVMTAAERAKLGDLSAGVLERRVSDRILPYTLTPDDRGLQLDFAIAGTITLPDARAWGSADGLFCTIRCLAKVDLVLQPAAGANMRTQTGRFGWDATVPAAFIGNSTETADEEIVRLYLDGGGGTWKVAGRIRAAAADDDTPAARFVGLNPRSAAYTLTLADAGRYVRIDSATAVDLTVPADASVAFPLGTQVHVRQAGAGQVTIVPGTGVTVNTEETLKLRKQGATVTLLKVAPGTWDLMGSLEAAPS